MRAGFLVAIVVLLALATCGCGRKAKPEPLWGAARLETTTPGTR